MSCSKISLRKEMCFNRKLYSYSIGYIAYLSCSGRIHLIFTEIITQTQTNASTILTIAPTLKGPSTVVAIQGTLELATTVQVGS